MTNERTKLTGMSALQLDALEEVASDLVVARQATTIVLQGTPNQLAPRIRERQLQLDDHRNHPYASLHAVMRKLTKLANSEQVGTVVTPEALGLPSDEEVIAEVTGQVRDAVLVKTDQEVHDTKAEIDRLRDAVEFARVELEQAEDESHAVGMQVLRLDDAGKAIPAKLKEEDEKKLKAKDRARVTFDNTEARLAQMQRKLKDLQDPSKIEQRVATRARLAQVKERTMATKQTAVEQGVPAAYLGNDGAGPNFGVGMDAACKGDICAAFAGVPKSNARHDWTTDESRTLGQTILDARGWNGFLQRKMELVAAKAAAAEQAAAAKAEAKAAKAAAKPKATKATKSSGQVKADPKPSRRKAPAAA